jgi:hypothetical protein
MNNFSNFEYTLLIVLNYIIYYVNDVSLIYIIVVMKIKIILYIFIFI